MAEGEHFSSDLFSGKIDLPPMLVAAPARKPARHEEDEPKHKDAFKTISETADMLALPQHVLRFWESKFTQVKPLKLKGGRRYYRPHDIETLFTIKRLLYKEGYTIKGARRAIGHTRKKEGRMPDENRKTRRRKTAIADTPLFESLAPAPVSVAQSLVAQARNPAPPQAEAPSRPASALPRKKELEKIRSELLQLREMLHALPALTRA